MQQGSVERDIGKPVPPVVLACQTTAGNVSFLDKVMHSLRSSLKHISQTRWLEGGIACGRLSNAIASNADEFLRILTFHKAGTVSVAHFGTPKF